MLYEIWSAKEAKKRFLSCWGKPLDCSHLRGFLGIIVWTKW
jgi:hypothetical protein